MEPCIARCIFYVTNEMQLIQYVVGLEQRSNPTTPAVDSRKA